MKTTTRSNIYLPMAALILTAAALAVPTAAQTQVPSQVPPFDGTFQGNDTLSREKPEANCPTTVCTTGTGTGTLLGQFSFTEELTINFANLTNTGSAHWKAANGDIIDTTVFGLAVPGPDVFTIAEIHIITGGTGRFAGAQGSFCVFRKHIVAFSPDGTHVTFGSFEGTITSPGAAH
jgi:hypothetical protein